MFIDLRSVEASQGSSAMRSSDMAWRGRILLESLLERVPIPNEQVADQVRWRSTVSNDASPVQPTTMYFLFAVEPRVPKLGP
jgi:hypothetical protein